MPAYWIVDSAGRTVDAYTLGEGAYRLAAGLEGPEARALPPFPDLTIEPAVIWA